MTSQGENKDKMLVDPEKGQLPGAILDSSTLLDMYVPFLLRDGAEVASRVGYSLQAVSERAAELIGNATPWYEDISGQVALAGTAMEEWCSNETQAAEDAFVGTLEQNQQDLDAKLAEIERQYDLAREEARVAKASADRVAEDARTNSLALVNKEKADQQKEIAETQSEMEAAFLREAAIGFFALQNHGIRLGDAGEAITSSMGRLAKQNNPAVEIKAKEQIVDWLRENVSSYDKARQGKTGNERGTLTTKYNAALAALADEERALEALKAAASAEKDSYTLQYDAAKSLTTALDRCRGVAVFGKEEERRLVAETKAAITSNEIELKDIINTLTAAIRERAGLKTSQEAED